MQQDTGPYIAYVTHSPTHDSVEINVLARAADGTTHHLSPEGVFILIEEVAEIEEPSLKIRDHRAAIAVGKAFQEWMGPLPNESTINELRSALEKAESRIDKVIDTFLKGSP